MSYLCFSKMVVPIFVLVSVQHNLGVDSLDVFNPKGLVWC